MLSASLIECVSDCCKLYVAAFLRYPDMLEVGRMEGAGETDTEESAHESASHFAACASAF